MCTGSRSSRYLASAQQGAQEAVRSRSQGHQGPEADPRLIPIHREPPPCHEPLPVVIARDGTGLNGLSNGSAGWYAMTEMLTRKQQVAVEALEAARQAGMTLSDYAKAQGLEVRPVYDVIAALRRRAALPGVPAGVRARVGHRVWRVASAELAVGSAARSGGMLRALIGALVRNAHRECASVLDRQRAECASPYGHRVKALYF